jgi:hypothetical protein
LTVAFLVVAGLVDLVTLTAAGLRAVDLVVLAFRAADLVALDGARLVVVGAVVVVTVCSVAVLVIV